MKQTARQEPGLHSHLTNNSQVCPMRFYKSLKSSHLIVMCFEYFLPATPKTSVTILEASTHNFSCHQLHISTSESNVNNYRR